MPKNKIAGRPADAPRIDILILLDRTGSMASNWSETIMSVNAYVQKMLNDQALKARVKLVVFDKMGNGPSIEVARDWSNDGTWEGPEKSKTAIWRQYDDNEHPPRGNTPLYDAIGIELSELFRKNRRKRTHRFQFVVMTDGYENASTEWNRSRVRELIKECQGRDGWSIVFLGADIDAEAIGASIGIPRRNSMRYDRHNTQAVFMNTLYASSSNFGASGQSIGFSVEEKQAAVAPKGAAGTAGSVSTNTVTAKKTSGTGA